MGKQKKQAALATKPASGIALASDWPVHEVLLSEGWDEEAALIIILIARRSPKSGKIASGSFLVDLACLGVKSVQVALNKDAAEYAADLRAHVMSLQPMAHADFDLAAKIILTGLNYAGNLGFKPDPVFAQAQYLLDGANPDACPTPVATGGPEGKPLFICGPNDNPHRIVNQLMRTVGEGNFHYVVQGTPEELGLSDDTKAALEYLAQRERK